jgi:spore coat polysaccharide biosynthesis protein SpsF (cytidylyltransferase family)
MNIFQFSIKHLEHVEELDRTPLRLCVDTNTIFKFKSHVEANLDCLNFCN